MKRPQTDSGEWASEEEAHRLLSRAVALDATQRAAVSVEDLQRAAAEAGIEPKAFAQALTELRSGALTPLTIGQSLAMRIARYRAPAAVAAFLSAAGITPGDAVILSALLGLGLYGAFEGLTALVGYFGQTPPRTPPEAQRTEVRSEQAAPIARERPGVRFVIARRWVRTATPSLG